MIADDDREISALAGEYVLGLLDAAEVAEIEAAIPAHRGLQAAVDFWQNRFQPLADAAPPAVPAPDGWSRIQRRLREAGMAQEAARRSPDRALRRWRGLAAGFAALAACLAIYVAARPSSPVPLPQVAVLNAPQSAQPGWLATIDGGKLTLSAIGATPAPAGKAYELWAIIPGTTAPAPLGIVPPDGKLSLTTARDFAQVTLAVSLEPSGGSPTGLPTGPVVFVGPVSQL